MVVSRVQRMTEPTILQGYSYPPIPLADVIAYEARQGRKVKWAIQHAGGWAVTGGNSTCLYLPDILGDDENCPVHGIHGVPGR